VLMGEGLGRLRDCGEEALGICLASLRQCVHQRLRLLQAEGCLADLPLPRLEEKGASDR
jgi:hypothetical protein